MLSSVRPIPDDRLWDDIDDADLPPHTAARAFRLLSSPDVNRREAQLRARGTQLSASGSSGLQPSAMTQPNSCDV